MDNTFKYALVALGMVLLVLAFYFLALPALFSTPSTCPSTLSPVCGKDGYTYNNACFASKANVPVAFAGRCPEGPNNTSLPTSCTETDGGKDPNTFGTVSSGGSTYSDSCSSSGSVLEYMCSNNRAISESMPCDSGYVCSSGSCVLSTPTPPPPSPNHTISPPSSSVCTDSDGGLNENIFGTATVSTGTLVASSPDYCVDVRTVNEYVCTAGIASSVRIVCSSDTSCVLGRCVSSASSLVSCNDSDSTNSPLIAGVTTLSNGARGTDTCTSSIGGIEYFCSGNDLSHQNFTCSSGMICDAGRCMASTTPPLPPPPTSVSCTDQDNGENVFFTATTNNSLGMREFDGCVGSDVKEFSCASNGSIVSRILSCPSGYSCSFGFCASTAPTCNDPDGGRFVYNATTVTRGTQSEPDSCRSDGVTVKEFFCNAAGFIDSADIPCDSGFRCSGGSCVGVTYALSCTDSDAGSSDPSLVSGSVSGYSTFAPYSHSDSCDERNVKEWSCSGSSPLQNSLSCSIGYPCLNGACTYACERLAPDASANDATVAGGTYLGSAYVPDFCLDFYNQRKVACVARERTVADIPCPFYYLCDSAQNRCVPDCHDPDGGENPTVAATTIAGGIRISDTCLTSDKLSEVICDSATNLPNYVEFKCSNLNPAFTCIPGATSADPARCG